MILKRIEEGAFQKRQGDDAGAGKRRGGEGDEGMAVKEARVGSGLKRRRVAIRRPPCSRGMATKAPVINLKLKAAEIVVQPSLDRGERQ